MSGEEVVYDWPQAEIGETVESNCSQSGGTAYRTCGGSYSQGASWLEPNDCQCQLNVDSATAQDFCDILVRITSLDFYLLCKVLGFLLLQNVDEVSGTQTLKELTMNPSTLNASDVSATVTLLERYTESAATNTEVKL